MLARVKSFPHPRSLSRWERDEKPFSLRDKGTLEAEQKGWDEGKYATPIVVAF